MKNTANINKNEAIQKLSLMINDVRFCFFKTNSGIKNNQSISVMTAQSLDNEGNVWFFSGKNSARNKEIDADDYVELYFSCPEKSTYLCIQATAVVVFDTNKIEELWNPDMKIWFTNGVADKNISLIKVTIKTASYWDSVDDRMINLLENGQV